MKARLPLSASLPIIGVAASLLLVAALAGCGEKSAPPPKAAAKPDINNNSSGNPITAPVDYLGAVAKAKKTAIKVTDVATLKHAIETFKSEEERYPKDLKELVGKQYIPALPAPPYQMKFQYDPTTGDVKVVPAQ